jgi:hypothetical protein
MMKRAWMTLVVVLGLALFGRELMASALFNLANLGYIGSIRSSDRGQSLLRKAAAVGAARTDIRHAYAIGQLRNGDFGGVSAEMRAAIDKLTVLSANGTQYWDTIYPNEIREWYNLNSLLALYRSASVPAPIDRDAILDNLREPGAALLFPHGDVNLRQNIAAVAELEKAGIWSTDDARRIRDLWDWRCRTQLAWPGTNSTCGRLTTLDEGRWINEHLAAGARVTMAAGSSLSDGSEAVRLDIVRWSKVDDKSAPYIEIVQPIMLQPQRKYKFGFRYKTKNFTSGHALVAILDYSAEQRYVFTHTELRPSDDAWSYVEVFGYSPSTDDFPVSLIIRNSGEGALIYEGILLEVVP